MPKPITDDAQALQEQLFSIPLDHPSRLEKLSGWGMAHTADAYVVRPSTPEQIETIFREAEKLKRKVTLRGSGQSYGDASIGQEAILVDCTRLNRVLSWDPAEGIIEVEPGVRIADLWQYTIEDGWWPPVVSGTMKPTLAGALAMNIHGKNNYKLGTIGDHILEFEMISPNGKRLTCSPEQNSQYFYAAIGSFGTLGFFTRIRLQMKRIHSGELSVRTITAQSLQDMADYFEANLDQDYLVGWIDCMAKGSELGRGVIHSARYLRPEEDPHPAKTLRAEYQDLPKYMFGVLPKSMMWMGLWMFGSRYGMKAVNAAKYFMDKRHAQKTDMEPDHWTHGAFHFLLDHVPNWKWGYKPGGLIQYQCFVPKDNAIQTFEKIIELSQQSKLESYLGVFKKHRPDSFLMTHALDGYSFALDFPITSKNRADLIKLTRQFTEVVLENGGRFYFAKDGLLEAEDIQRAFPKETLEKFSKIKADLDPENLLETDLSRRLFNF